MRTALAIAICVLIAFVALRLFSFRAEIAPIPRSAAGTFDAALVARGAELAAIGNCDVCHTRDGGELFAGARPVLTPFGAIYSTNITPDPETGIGNWSGAAFQRAMREGVSRTGQQLYPAFPYEHFTKITDDDNRALYAYLMTRNPVRAPAIHNEIWFPLSLGPSSRLGRRFFSRPVRTEPSLHKVLNGIAALILPKGSDIAGHVTRRAMHSARNEPADLTLAPVSRVGTRMRSMVPRPRRLRGPATACRHTCRAAGMFNMACRMAPWRP